MPVWRVFLAAFAFTVVATIPAAAAQTEPTIEVGIGLGGFMSAERPGEVTVEISTPVLIAGRLRVSGGGMSVSRPVEVPAGSEQSYELAIPPLQDGTRLTVEVLDGDEEILSEVVTTRLSSSEQLTVGVVADDSLVNALGRVRTVVTGHPVSAFLVSPTERDLGVLDYLVVGRNGADAIDAASDWARSGGRLVVDAAVASTADDGVAVGVEGVSRVPLGEGEMLVVDGLDGRSTDDWAEILRPAPIDLAGSWDGRPRGAASPLLQAASESGSRQVPSLPWLLFAILGFAVLVGPVNFVVLSRLGKRDWAWVTIPSVALLAVVGFWVAGRQRIAGTNLTHASIITQQASVEARSVVLVAAGAAGERELAFNPDSLVYPERPLSGGAGPELRMLGEGTAAVDLGQLGFTGVGMWDSTVDVELPSVRVDGNEVVVQNQGDLTYWGWGSVAGDASTVASGELAADSTGVVPLPRGGRAGGFGFSFIDALMNERQLWEDPVRNNSLWPLSQVLSEEIDRNGTYFVGLTDDYRPELSASGGAGSMAGPTLVVVRAETDEIVEEAAAVVVDTGLVNWMEPGPQRVISTDELTVRFRVPAGSSGPQLNDANRFGAAPAGYEAWNWDNGEFVDVELGEMLPAAVIAPDGEVYVRIVGANEFGDNPMSPDDLSIEWEV